MMNPESQRPMMVEVPKIDTHCHVFDPLNFPYHPDVAYRPAGGEIAPASYLRHLMDSHGIRHALLVQPNSGYGADNRCLLDAIETGGNRFKGIAIADGSCSDAELQELKARGVVGIAHNFALLGEDGYPGHEKFWQRLAAAGLLVQIQVRDDQITGLAPAIRNSSARFLIDHCGRPGLRDGLQGAGFSALLALAETGRCYIKLSGFDKFSALEYPYLDADRHVAEILAAYGPAHCLWASDWPHLRARQRLDIGALLKLFEQQVPDPVARQQILFDTPFKLLGFQRD